MEHRSLSHTKFGAGYFRDECSSLFSDLLANESDENVMLLRRPVLGTVGDHSSIAWKNLANTTSCAGNDLEIFPECFGHTSVMTKNKDRVICYGGRNAFDYFGDIWEYHISSSTWTKITQENDNRFERVTSSPSRVRSSMTWPAPRTGHSAAIADQKMFILCGEIGAHAFSRELLSWDVEKREWEIECASVPFPPRKGHSMHYLPHQNTLGRSSEDMLLVFGGILVDGSYTNEVLLYTFSSKSWSRSHVKGNIPRPRGYHVSQMLSDAPFLLVFGGQGEADVQDTTRPGSIVESENSPSPGRVEYFNCLSILDVSLGLWKRVVSTNSPSPRSCACSLYENEELAIFCGGANGTYATDILQLHISSPDLARGEVQGTWRALEIMGTPQCSCSTIVYANAQLLLFGGIFENRKFQHNLLSISLGRIFLTSSCRLFQLQARRKEKAKRTAARLLLKMEKGALSCLKEK